MDPEPRYFMKMEKFEDKLVTILNYGALNLALGIGYKHRIFDVMEDLNRPMTIPDLAGKSGLDERYLREWLGIVVTGGIIELSADSSGEDHYFLPPSHAGVLTRKAGSNNLGVYTQEIPLLTLSALQGVEQGFITGEGVPFSAYPDFQAFMSELADAKHEQTLIQNFLPSVDGGKLISRLEKGIRVCDLGCGQGVALNLMARAFPRSEFMGMDNHGEAIQRARSSAQDLSNVNYRVLDAARLKEDQEFRHQFEYITAFDAIHDQSHPLQALESIRHMLSPGGLFSMVDIKAGSRHRDNLDHPMGPFLYTVSLMHCMPVGLNDRGRGLGMMWGKEKALALLARAGFDRVEVLDIPNDGFNLHFLCRG
ncbi:class I SAM-dependent methyltransferase [Desulfospira joergensenii]|uniref:class I SAM-dependent methyltransferase n=1 Tax=Desulfospira joergensenii TaxID=53329 RepID=UPI0003B41CC4|nr:methyltransferase domain-containing protein [Desulfospira joergensenii]